MTERSTCRTDAATRKRKRKRKFGKLSHEAILARIADGSLVVDVDEARVYRVGRGGELQELKQYPRGRCGRYRGVCIYSGGSRIKIAVHKLVWLADSGEPIPDGYEVHHEDRDPSNNRISNLDLQTKAEHLATHDKGYPDEWDDDDDF
jgi:hypothetical protein